MKASELAEKMATHVPYAGEDQGSAKLAFLLHVLGGMGDTDIPEAAIREAHLVMHFPFQRAIVSTCLGHKFLTRDGVPDSYFKRAEGRGDSPS